MRRMPPSKVEHNLAGLLNLVDEDEDVVEELLQRVDQPLQVETDKSTGQKFLLCDYNRDGDSYRSPWSNKYFPAFDDGFLPSDKLRKLEVRLFIISSRQSICHPSPATGSTLRVSSLPYPASLL